jgi:ubiquinone/menaquinone biosynthesis C-methylase UbiE
MVNMSRNRVIALGLVIVAGLLGILSLVQYSARLIPVSYGALALAVPGVLVLVGGASLFVVDLRQSTAGAGGRSGPAGRSTALIAGRVRTRGIPYQLPHDMEEMNRLDFQHYMLRALLRGNYSSPIRNPQSILDVGSGTGRWAREMAVTFPNAAVVGLDINPPAVDEAAEARGGVDLRPPNYTFVPGNLLEGLPFADASFDFVHMRALLAAIPHDRWPAVVAELVRVTRPGGWVESREITQLEQGGPAMDLLMGWLTAALALRGVQMADGGKVGDLLQAVGPSPMTVQKLQVPCGDSGGRMGKMLAIDWFSLLSGVGGIITARGIATPEQMDQALAAARADLASVHIRCIMPTYIAYGRRVR